MSLINASVVAETLNEKFGEALYDWADPDGIITFSTNPENVPVVVEYLFLHKQYQFRFLTDICGVHYPHNTGKELSVVYHLHSLINNFRLRIKTFCSLENPKVPTLTKLYASANWMERETYDFYGIVFEGHPDLRRILNVDEMDYFPMRKEFPLEDATRRDKVDLFFGR